MAYKDNETLVSYEAGSDLSASQFHFVSLSADGQVDLTGDGVRAIGVLQNKPSAAGRAATVAIAGKTRVEAGGSVTRGAVVASNASGECVDAASGDWILGEALEAGSDGDVITIQLQINSGTAPV